MASTGDAFQPGAFEADAFQTSLPMYAEGQAQGNANAKLAGAVSLHTVTKSSANSKGTPVYIGRLLANAASSARSALSGTLAGRLLAFGHLTTTNYGKLTGSVPLHTTTKSSAATSSHVSVLTALLVKSTTAVAAKFAGIFKGKLTSNSNASSTSKGVLTGSLPLAAKTESAARAKGLLNGIVAIVAKTASSARSITNLFTGIYLIATGRSMGAGSIAAPTMRMAFKTAMATASGARSALSGTVNIAGQAATAANTISTPTWLMAMIASGRSMGSSFVAAPAMRLSFDTVMASIAKASARVTGIGALFVSGSGAANAASHLTGSLTMTTLVRSNAHGRAFVNFITWLNGRAASTAQSAATLAVRANLMARSIGVAAVHASSIGRGSFMAHGFSSLKVLDKLTGLVNVTGAVQSVSSSHGRLTGNAMLRVAGRAMSAARSAPSFTQHLLAEAIVKITLLGDVIVDLAMSTKTLAGSLAKGTKPKGALSLTGASSRSSAASTQRLTMGLSLLGRTLGGGSMVFVKAPLHSTLMSTAARTTAAAKAVGSFTTNLVTQASSAVHSAVGAMRGEHALIAKAFAGAQAKAMPGLAMALKARSAAISTARTAVDFIANLAGHAMASGAVKAKIPSGHLVLGGKIKAQSLSTATLSGIVRIRAATQAATMPMLVLLHFIKLNVRTTTNSVMSLGSMVPPRIPLAASSFVSGLMQLGRKAFVISGVPTTPSLPTSAMTGTSGPDPVTDQIGSSNTGAAGPVIATGTAGPKSVED